MAPTTPTPTQTDADLTGLKLYTLEEVAAQTGLSLRSLKDGARLRRFEHVHRGRGFTRFMTAEQIHKLIHGATVTPEAVEQLVSEREAHERNGRRTARRRSAAAA